MQEYIDKDRAEKRLRMLEISMSKSFDRPFVWRHASLISRSILASCHSRRWNLGCDLKVLLWWRFFQTNWELVYLLFGCFTCKSRGNPANS